MAPYIVPDVTTSDTPSIATQISLMRFAGRRQPIPLIEIEKKLHHEQPRRKTSSALIKPVTDDGQRLACSSVHRLTETARLVTRTDPENFEFQTILQVLNDSAWSTVGCYECKRGHACRYLYSANGTVDPFIMDLPASVVKQMACLDFQRNWLKYWRDFISGNE